MGWVKKIFKREGNETNEQAQQPVQVAAPASSGAPGIQPAFTGEQMRKALAAYKERKKARQKAREEEARYVEFRKAEVLAKFHPTVGTLRSTDEAFPKRRRGSMGFGERKAHYLAIRPKPIYATWLGRRRNTPVIEAKAPPVAMAAAVDMTDHSALPDSSSTTGRDIGQDLKGEEYEESGATDSTSKSSLTSSSKGSPKAKDKTKDKSAVTQAKSKEKSDIKGMSCYGKNADNPLVNGTPFWVLFPPPDDDDMTDDDLPVDMDILEQVCTGKKALDPRPYNKTVFDPFGPVSKMKADDVLFDRDTILFSNTVESVIRLQPEGDEKPKPRTPIPRKLTWSKNISVTTFNVKDRRPKEVGRALSRFRYS
ncbi:unnamed protein product [Toxocara canis]|uniref:Uncharacterized protein n=1 Tax=Toxocara canis TaxID=6265 RepID=A0A183UM50_TOXCA|nr:unnamed protein product [Toxocara canis]